MPVKALHQHLKDVCRPLARSAGIVAKRAGPDPDTVIRGPESRWPVALVHGHAEAGQ